MTNDDVGLDEFEQDAIAELANLGVSRAANSLRQMLGEQVLVSVPMARIVSRGTAAQLVEGDRHTRLVAVQQTFDGPFSGAALLIFSEPKSLELVRAIVGSEKSLQDVMDLEQEALGEIGNIILNACLGTMANVLHQQIHISLPTIIRGDGPTLFGNAASQSENLVLFLYIDFKLRERQIGGFIALLMDLPAVTTLRKLVREYVDGLGKS